MTETPIDPSASATGPRAGRGCYRLAAAETAADGTTWETFTPSVHVGSPWGPGIQHGGPVAGLLARSMELCRPRERTRMSRLTVEILGPVPLSTLQSRVWVERPGRKIELLAGELCAAHADGRTQPVARARAWRLATHTTEDVAHHADARLPFPDRIGTKDIPTYPLPDSWRTGFTDALDWQVISPIGARHTPTAAWMRLTQPLVANESTSAFARTVAVADIANGLGARLDPHEWTFLNTELSVHLFEPPEGTWIGLECESSIGRDGIAMSSGVIHTPDGPVGRVIQNVLVEKRTDPVVTPLRSTTR
ncbi:thioesterase family protein [Rhodococcus sp. CSLK01-03]|uniref:Thioesterase family protein n=1 Tax=Rhodococcus indonesiensis TaxID=3055869 RepID=A0ABT7RTD2_9NOCA|nr:thioesterase family protein [Rhodococcus indonesiensis]MDM7490887.1 thioesterase family protein [Rhodococcus indonesiensis]